MIIHVHIPKNGGTTLNRVLERCFGQGLVELYPLDRPGYFMPPAEMAEALRRHHRAQAVASHEIRYPCPAVAGLHYEYVTFLRHPIDRLVSLYFYEKKITTEKGQTHSSQQSFEEWFEIRTAEDRATVNWQCYHLHSSGQVEQAKQVLSNFAVAGLVERYDLSLALLNARLVLPWPRLIGRRENMVMGISARSFLSPATYHQVARLNEADLELYRFCADRFEVELSRRRRYYSIAGRSLKLANRLAQTQHHVRRSVRDRLSTLVSSLRAGLTLGLAVYSAAALCPLP